MSARSTTVKLFSPACQSAIITTIALWLMAFMFTPDAATSTVLVLYLVLCAGLALLFSPLFTVAMASVKPKFYTYASAGIGTVQQIAGALGTSVFMVIYSLGRGIVPEGQLPAPEAVAAGTHGALLVAAFAAISIVILVFFIKKPAAQDAAIGHVVLH